ncbi:MAG: iron ABC transporter permease [Oscillospiraceae bacterium]|nr:iron ABC transporter permease [Oscillospiraceae bacterium]
MTKGKITAMFTLLSVGVIAVLFANLFTGSADISVSDAVTAILGEENTASDILWKIRMPRALASLLLGGALSLSGYLLQTFFHNPIAGPFVLGVSSGAKLIVAISMIFSASFFGLLSSAFMIISAFVGSMISLGFVLLVSRKVRQMSMLVVCGVMIGYICSAVTDFLVTFADDSDIINLHDWSMGTFSGTSMDNVKVIFIFVLIGLVGTILISKPIGAYMLGESYAQNMGVNIKLLRALLIILSGLLSASVTAFAGPVSFVGIAVPHIIRVLFKTSKPLVMIPACFLGGSIFCMLCDMIARTVFAPTELSISTVTAIFGAPVVIVIMLNRKRGEING